MLYLLSSLCKVTTCSRERLLSTRLSNVARISNVSRVSLKRAPVGGRRFRPSVAVATEYRFRPDFGRAKFAIFIFAVFLFLCNGRVDARLVTVGDCRVDARLVIDSL